MQVIVLLSVLLLIIIPNNIYAQTGMHNDGHTQLHEYYRKLYIPNMPTIVIGSCCNERVVLKDGTVIGDCRQVRAWQDDNGRWVALVDGIEVLIPDLKIIRRNQPPAPDGNSHLCMNESLGTIHCFVPGQPKS